MLCLSAAILLLAAAVNALWQGSSVMRAIWDAGLAVAVLAWLLEVEPSGGAAPKLLASPAARYGAASGQSRFSQLAKPARAAPGGHKPFWVSGPVGPPPVSEEGLFVATIVDGGDGGVEAEVEAVAVDFAEEKE